MGVVSESARAIFDREGETSMTKAEAEKILQKPKFGDAKCIEAVARLDVSEDLEDFLRSQCYDPDKLGLQEIKELADRMGYESQD